MAQDEYEEAESLLKAVEWQVGEVKCKVIERTGPKLDMLVGFSGLFPI